MENRIRVIGIGPGNLDLITPEALKYIHSSDILVGGERNLRNFADLNKEKYMIKNNLSEMIELIKKIRQDKVIGILASGDPGFYGILEYLKRFFSAEEMMVIPGLSSVQVACARLGLSWHDAASYSVHGRDIKGLAELVKIHPKVTVLTDPQRTPAVIAGLIIESGLTHKTMYVCENLSYPDERIKKYDIGNVPDDTGLSGCVVVIVDR